MDVLSQAKHKLNHLGTELMSKAEVIKEESSEMAKAMIEEAQGIQQKIDNEAPSQKGNIGNLPGDRKEKSGL